jgi:tetrapyrrole methylase family protein/MazG family protein
MKEVFPREKIFQELDLLLRVLERLRSPQGCLWDRKQERQDLRRYLLEESYEVADAMEEGSDADIEEELGDLLYQILTLVHIIKQEGGFGLEDVLIRVREKMISRHPHVFAGADLKSVAEIRANWERLKKAEASADAPGSFFSRLPRSGPALARAQKATEMAQAVGFDWATREEVIVKIEEELDELKKASAQGDAAALAAEAGDIIFSVVNLCRFAGIEAEKTLQEATGRFITRLEYIEEQLRRSGRSLDNADGEEMNRLWEEAKGQR